MEQTITTAIALAKTSLTERRELSPECQQKLNAICQTYQSYEDFNLQNNPDTDVLYASDERKAIMEDYSTLAMLDMALGDNTASRWLVTLLANLNKFSGSKNMDDGQTENLARLIAQEYGDMKYSVMLLFFYRFKCGYFGKFWGKVDPIVITCALKDFKEEIFRKQQEYINLEYKEKEARIKQKREDDRQRWRDCQTALCQAAIGDEMRKVFQNIVYEDLYENDTVLIQQVLPEEYAMIEKRFIQVFSPVIRRFYPNVKLNYRMRKPEPPKVDKEKEKLQKQISETLNSARRLITNELGWDKDTIETAKYGFKLKYKLSPDVLTCIGNRI